MKPIVFLLLVAPFCSASSVTMSTMCDSQYYATNSCSTAWSQATTSATYTATQTALTINASTSASTEEVNLTVGPIPNNYQDRSTSEVQISDTFFVPGSGAGYLQVTNNPLLTFIGSNNYAGNGLTLLVNGTNANIPSFPLSSPTFTDIPITLGSTVTFQFAIDSQAYYNGGYATASTDMTLQFFNQQNQIVDIQGAPEPSTLILALPTFALCFITRRKRTSFSRTHASWNNSDLSAATQI